MKGKDNNIMMKLLSPNEMEIAEIETFPFINNQEQNKKNKKSSKNIDNTNVIQEKISYPTNIFSSLTFHWVFDTITKSKKNKNLKFSYLGSVSSDYESEKIFKEIEKIWYEKYNHLLIKNNSENKISIYPLFISIVKSNICRLTLAIILYIIISCFDFIGIIMFKELLTNFKENNNKDENIDNNEDITKITFLKSLSLYQLILLMIGHKFISLVLNRQTQFIAELISIRATTQLSLLIYHKLLKIPTFNMNEFTEGKIINLFQTDTETLGDFFTNAGLIIIVPFKIIYSCYLLIIYFKLAFFPGIFILIAMGSLFGIFRGKQKQYQNEWIKATDERMSITSKTFDIIKILKLYSWEKIFKKMINDKREIENKANYKKLNLQVFVATINGTVETLLVMTCIIFYNIIYKQMEVENILTSLYIIHQLVEPLFMLPTFFVSLFEINISLIRIQNFLSINNHDYSQIEYLSDKAENSDSPYSIIISNVDFGVEKTIKNNNIIDEDGKQNNTEKINENFTTKELSSINDNINKNILCLDIVNMEDNLSNEEDKNKNELLINDSADNINKQLDTLIKFNDTKKIILLKDIKVNILKGEHIGIIGEVGSGKTCLLNAFINNLKVFPKNKNDIGNIKLSGNISFVSQNPWILNTTVEENILLFNKKDEERYKKIVSICQLEQDFKCLENGDKTEIGEKGINLSGGQKARISIARAIYSNAEIYIFDDPLSALDAYVGMKLFKEVFNDFLKEKTFIISTHALQYLCFFDRIFYMKKGKIEWVGTFEEINKQDFYQDFVDLHKNEKNKNEEDKNIKNENENKKSEQKSQKKEEINNFKNDKKKKKLSCSTFMIFIKFSGGLRMILEIFLTNIIWKSAQIYSDYYLSSWSSQKYLNKKDNNSKLLIYVLITIPIIITVILRKKYMGDAYMRFNIKMHDLLIDKLINAPINLFHDITPRGYILNILSKDLNTASRVNIFFSGALRLGFQALGSIIVCIFFNIWTLPIIIIIIILEIYFSSYVLQTLKDISRLEGIYRAPLIGVFSETLAGLNTIRAFHYENNFVNKFNSKMNDYFKICLFQKGISGWYGIILDIISFGLLTFILISCGLFKEKYNPQSIGLLLTYSFNFINQFFSFMGRFNDLTKMFASVERCENLTKIVQEKYPILESDKNLPKFKSKIGRNYTFISEGNIEFYNYSVKYRENTPLVLYFLNFKIKGSEKVGVVGRTGSGKSTLCLCLFRLLEAFSGNIYIDGIDISQIGLEILRNNLTIIPQEPILIKGSLKHNIDPTDMYTENEIINMIYELGLDEFFDNKKLSYEIEENGSNISVGERQLICIARALIRKTKIIIMDEATANIDYKTEALLQTSINKGMKDCTVITIAHRIKTIINYDKILVLDKGKIVEFDSPDNLIKQKGLFYQLYKESFL